MSSGSPIFQWLSIPSIDACAPDTISWNYTGPDLFVDIHLSAPNASGEILPTFGTTLATGVNVRDGRWTWASADVPAGRYFFFINALFFARSPFFNIAATEQPCVLSAASPSTIPAVSASTPSTIPRPDGVSPISAGAATSSPSPSSSHHTAAIAGGAVAAALVLALALLFFMRFWNRRRRSAKLRAWRAVEDGRRVRAHEKRPSIFASPHQTLAEPPSAYRLDWSPPSPRSPLDDGFGARHGGGVRT